MGDDLGLLLRVPPLMPTWQQGSSKYGRSLCNISKTATYSRLRREIQVVGTFARDFLVLDLSKRWESKTFFLASEIVQALARLRGATSNAPRRPLVHFLATFPQRRVEQ